MLSIHKIMLLMVMTLSFATPAFALEINADRNSPNAAAGSETGKSKLGYHEWMGEEGKPERKDLREEREQIRLEHERLQSERDRLKVECLNTKGQERSACETKMQEMRTKREALHDRMRAFHEKAQAVKMKRHKKNKTDASKTKKSEKPAAAQ